MSNDRTAFSNVDNLTPFEYALAGVEIPEARDSPSLGVIHHMRLLASEVPETPVTHAGLAELLRTGSIASRRHDRRSRRNRRPTTAADAAASVSDAGGFVDITPIELAEDEKPAKTDAVGDESIAAAAAVAGAAAIINLDDPDGELQANALDEVELQTSEFEASELVPTEASEPMPPTMPQPIVAESEPEPESEPEEFSEELTDDFSDEFTDDFSDEFTDDFTDDFTEFENEFSDEPELTVLLEDDGESPALATATPAAIELASEDPIGSDEDWDDEGAVLVGVGAAGVAGILNDTGEPYSSAPSIDPIETFTKPSKPERRRVGGAFWALAGTATAAAVLVLGGFWWANGLSDRTEADIAAPPSSLGDGLDPEDGAVQSGSPSEDDEADANATSQDSDELDIPPAPGDFGDSEDSEPGRSSDSTTSTPTTVEAQQAGGDPTTPADQSAQSTVAADPTTTATEAPNTTTAPEVTIKDTTSIAPTTVTQQTTVTTSPPPTAPPTTAAALGVIGDSVNIGSRSGPGIAGVRVDIYNDPDGDGQPNRLIETTKTNANGRYRFDVPGGCYVVRFTTISGYTLDQGLATQDVCVNPGGTRRAIDAILFEIQSGSRPPDGCTVEDSSNTLQGVEVYEGNSDWAESYIFYGQNGNVIYTTPSWPHDVDGTGNDDWEWAGEYGDFIVTDVWTVSANRDGVLSVPITCYRE